MFESQSVTDPTYSRKILPTIETPVFGEQCPSSEGPPLTNGPRVYHTGLSTCWSVPTGSPLIDLTGTSPQSHRIRPEDKYLPDAH